MWKQGGRSSALDRAQALLSAKRSGRGDAASVRGSTARTRGAVGGSAEPRSAPQYAHTSFPDVSELSSVSSAPERGAHTAGPAAAASKRQGGEGDLTKDLRPPSSLGGGGGSRFMKKAPPPAHNSSQSPVSKSQMRQAPEPRYVSSSQRGSQTAALSRLAQIESRIHSRKQARQGPVPAENLTSDLGPPAAAQSLEASVQLSAQSSSDPGLKGKRFLKNNMAVAVNSSNTAAAGSPEGPDVGVRSRSRAADAVVPSADVETKSVRVVSGGSLESDEEDMRKLLGDSLDSTDKSFLIPGRPSSKRAAKTLSQSSQKVDSSPRPAAAPPSSASNTPPPRSPASPSRRSSPFRFTGRARAHFSPSVLSPSPSPPRASPSPPGGLNSRRRAGSPQRSLSSMSGRSEVLSLAELFPAGPGSPDPHSEMSAVSTEEFKINAMTLDDLVPATLDLTEETQGKEREARHSAPVPGSKNRQHQVPKLNEKEEEQQQQQQQQEEEEDVLDYQSDFESESRTEPDHTFSQVSEHLQGDGDEEEVVSEVREEASDSDVSRGRTEDDYSSPFSDSYTSPTLRGRGDSRSSVSHGSRTSSRQSGRRASTRTVLKEAAVQTQPDPLAYTWPAGMATFGPAVGMTYVNPTPGAPHTLSAEIVEALSTFNPAVFALNEMLKQQLATTRRSIESSRHLHSSLVRSLEPPNYRYTTLEDTKEYIRKRRPPGPTTEEALQEVLQEMG